jgi:hypothetical protein
MFELYQIDQSILACVDEETGTVVDEAALEALSMVREKKIEQIAICIKSLTAEAKMLKEEKDELQKRQVAAEKKAEAYKNFLLNYLHGEKFSSTKAVISFRSSESVDIVDEAIIPEDYWKPQDPVIDKAKIRTLLKEGTKIPGATLVKKQNITVK